MYTLDIANAFVKFLNSNVTGCVNICSGEGISIRNIALRVAEKLEKYDLLYFADNEQNQPSIIVGDNARLTKCVDYQLQYSINMAIQNIIEFEKE
jgi:nucleoside-diphosphate-sugar epimerase